MTEDAISRVGQQIGNYHLVKLLGQGAFADVYLGKHILLKTQVAIKLMRVRLTKEPLEAFLNEAQTVARLRHPHIVRVFEGNVEDGVPYLVMDYFPRGTLREHYPSGTQLSPTQVAPFIEQLAAALSYAHQQRLIHRDVKPENILVDEDGQLLLSDFGLVLSVHSSTSETPKGMAGTVPYMAPEQLQGHPRFASDQYALGIIAYEWLTGERPFKGSFVEIASQHMLVPPVPPRQKVPTLPEAVEQVVLKALAKEPTQRFANTVEFAQALKQACTDLSSLPTSQLAPLEHPSPQPPMQQAHLRGTTPSTLQVGPTVPPAVSEDVQHSNTSPLSNPISPIIPPTTSSNTTQSDVLPPPNPNTSRDSSSQMPVIAPQGPLSVSELGIISSAASWPSPSATPSTLPSAPIMPQKLPPARRRNRLIFLATTCALTFLLLCTVGWEALASSGLVHIPGLYTPPTPTGQALSTTPNTNRDATKVASTKTHTLPSSTRKVTATKTKSSTVQATGKGTISATSATGTITIHLPPIIGNCNMPAGTIFTTSSNTSLQASTNAPVTLIADADTSFGVTVSPGGVAGNVSAYAVWYATVTNASGTHTVNGVNNQAFTGGQDTQSYTAVQQSDIDNAASQLTPSTTQAATDDLHAQANSNEQLVETPQCTSTKSSDHAAGDQASTVTVTVQTTCTGTLST
jgi:serine/threonine protein kinase